VTNSYPPERQTDPSGPPSSGSTWPSLPNWPGYNVPDSGRGRPAPERPAHPDAQHFQSAAARGPAFVAARIAAGLLSVVVLTLIVWSFSIERAGAQKNLTTLRADAARIQPPAGYAVSSTSETGTDCRRGPCNIKQIWIWRGHDWRTTADTCIEAGKAMKAAFSLASQDSHPPSEACEYSIVLTSFRHPDKGKRTVQAIVPVSGPGTIELTVFYL